MRKGFSLMELQVAFVVLAIAMSGLCPLVVMQSRHLKKIENRLKASDTHYVTPSTNTWARKLGAGAVVSTTVPAAAPSAPVLLIDDGDSGFSTQGSGWTQMSGTTVYPPGSNGKNKGQAKSLTAADTYGGDCYYHNSDNGSKSATWAFTGLTPGYYEVRITWLEGSGLATNAPFAVYNGTTLLRTLRVNQTIAPSGAAYGGRPWQSLGTFSIKGDQLKLVLIDDVSGKVIADGARLLRVQNDVKVLSIDKTMTGEAVTAHVSVTKLVP